MKIAIADGEAILKLNPDSPNGHAVLVYLMSCCPDAALCDGKKALEHAQRCFDLSYVKTGNDYWRMAATHAECGNLAKAVEFQTQAITLEPKNTEWPKQLALYQSGKPYRIDSTRETARDGGDSR